VGTLLSLDAGALGERCEENATLTRFVNSGLAYAILNSCEMLLMYFSRNKADHWVAGTAMAASLSVALPSGGPSAVIWGM
jgi:hypothetical protein